MIDLARTAPTGVAFGMDADLPPHEREWLERANEIVEGVYGPTADDLFSDVAGDLVVWLDFILCGVEEMTPQSVGRRVALTLELGEKDKTPDLDERFQRFTARLVDELENTLNRFAALLIDGSDADTLGAVLGRLQRLSDAVHVFAELSVSDLEAIISEAAN